MSNSIFLDQTFKIYKANKALGVLSAKLEEYFLVNIAQFLYTKSQNRKGELIQHYESYEEIAEGLTIESSERQYGGYSINYLIIKHRYASVLPRQIIICITKDGVERNFNTIILQKISSPSINNLLLSLVEGIDFDEPLIIKDFKLGYSYIKNVLNQLFIKLSQYYTNPINNLIGDIEMVYSQRSGHINDNIRNIIINVPTKDIAQLQESSHEFKLIDLINNFLYNSSKINFDKLSIVKFSSTLLSLSIEGRFKISSANITLIDTFEPPDYITDASNASDDSPSPIIDIIKDKDTLIWFLLGSVYNSESAS